MLKTGILLAVFMVLFITTGLAYAEEFDVRLLPSKMVEKSEGIMHVFVAEGEEIIPKKITDLTITSLDSSILHIEKIKDTNSFITEVTVKAGKPGTTTLYLAAPGYTSKEIPVTIHGNKNSAATLLIKVTPDTFTTSSPNEGYVAVELADEDGSPVIAKQDITVSLSTANKEIVELSSSNLIIKKGEYYAYTKFHTKKSGEAVLYATSNGIETQSTTITVKEDTDLTVKMYVYPKTVTIHDVAKGFIIAQLQDSSGKPVLAQKDITVYYKAIESDYSEATNYSDNYKQKNSGYFTIQKGSYWGYTQYSLPKGIEDTYDVSISTEDPLVIETEEIEAMDLEMMDDKLIKFETFPILTTGRTELIGVLYLEDESENPVVAKKNISIKIDSSDAASLVINDVRLSRGDQIALVYGKTSHSAPSDLQLRPVVAEGEMTDVTVFGPDKDSVELVAEPLIADVLSGTTFPIVFYLKDGDEVTSFPEDRNVFMSPNEYVELAPTFIPQKSALVISDAKSLKKGTADISFEVGDFKSSSSIESVSSEPAQLSFDHAKSIFVGANDIFVVQLLNSDGSPTYATDNVDVNLVVKEKGLVDIPTKITIEKGNYFALFDAAPRMGGETDVSLLSKELPLLSEQITITSLTPVLAISGPDSVNASDTFLVTVSAKAGDKILSGMNVDWKVEDGIIQIADPQTGTTGEAVASIIPHGQTARITATVSGQWYSAATITKTVPIHSDSGVVFVQEENSEPEYQAPEIFGIDPVLIIVPGAIGAVGFMLKKKGQFAIKK